VLCLLALAAALGGCGGSGPAPGTPEDDAAAPYASTTAGFPDRVRTLLELRGGLEDGPVLSPKVTLLRPGANRFSFALLDPPGEAPRPAAVALYTAKPDGRGVRGPFLARRESLRVPARLRSQAPPGERRLRDLWVARVDFAGPGRQVVTALTRPADAGAQDGLVATNQLELRVDEPGGDPEPPAPGEPAVRVHTDPADSRTPPLPALHRTDLVDALGRRPLVLVFAAPGRCPTAECAQVVDVAATVRAQTGVEVIHQETFRAADAESGLRAQARAWRLPTPAWTFVIDADGRVVTRFEGPVSVRELGEAVQVLRP